MSEMIERVSKAIRVAKEAKEDLFGGDEWWSYDDMSRAAIQAMREPTETMIEQAELTGRDIGEVILFDVEPCWKAMIDAALQSSHKQGDGK